MRYIFSKSQSYLNVLQENSQEKERLSKYEKWQMAKTIKELQHQLRVKEKEESQQNECPMDTNNTENLVNVLLNISEHQDKQEKQGSLFSDTQTSGRLSFS